jgi:hypothetical protein
MPDIVAGIVPVLLEEPVAGQHWLSPIIDQHLVHKIHDQVFRPGFLTR